MCLCTCKYKVPCDGCEVYFPFAEVGLRHRCASSGIVCLALQWCVVLRSVEMCGVVLCNHVLCCVVTRYALICYAMVQCAVMLPCYATLLMLSFATLCCAVICYAALLCCAYWLQCRDVRLTCFLVSFDSRRLGPPLPSSVIIAALCSGCRG